MILKGWKACSLAIIRWWGIEIVQQEVQVWFNLYRENHLVDSHYLR